MEEDSHSGHEADVLAGKEGGANGEAVGEVMKGVRKEVQVAGHPHLLFPLSLFLVLRFSAVFC